MYIKLLLLSQILAISFNSNLAHSHDYIGDVETLDDQYYSSTVEPNLSTTQPDIADETQATAKPDEGLKILDEGLGIMNTSEALKETTIAPPEESTPTTTSSTTTTTTTTTKKPTLPHPQTLNYPYPHQFPQRYPYPYPHPGLVHTPFYPEPEAGSKSTPKPGQDYPYPSYPILRPPYSPYGLPEFRPQFPDFPAGIPYGKPLNLDDETKTDQTTTTDELAKTPLKSDEPDKTPATPEEKDTKLDYPPFGYPPVYLIQRRPFPPTNYPYASPARGYGSPYGYRF